MLTIDTHTQAPAKATDLTLRDKSWFAQRVERGRKEVFLEIVTVTPEIARRILETNPDNRPIHQGLVAQIADDIARGRYALNGETIIISKDGLLNDGQHRLEAVIRADKPIQSAMMFGVDRVARFTTDMGRQRSSSVFLQMSGVGNYNHCAAVALALYAYAAGSYGNTSGRSLTKQAVLRTYREFQPEIDAAVHLMRGDGQIRTSGPVPFAVAYILLGRVNRAKRDEFFDGVLSGANLDEGSPILALRYRLLTLRPKEMRIWARVELILRHWNRWRAGQPVKEVIKLRGAYPEIVK